MTLQDGDSQRKSSVYNQTGQNYFEQLSSYNRMNSHLRRILMAQSVVDARNKKYVREKRSNSRSSSCSKSLDQILSRSDFIDGVAYDTEHHPIDLLRMRLGCDPNCLHVAKKRSLEQSYRSCSNIRCRGGSPRTSRRPEVHSDLARYSRTSTSGSPIRCPNRSYGSSRSSLLTGRRTERQPEVENARQKLGDAARNEQDNRRTRGFEAINETYSYDSSFESSSDTSGRDSPVAKNCGCPSSRPNFRTSPERTDKNVLSESKKSPNHVDRTEEAKYAKFLYNITQEIVSKGLYTDQELDEVFQKHVDQNCGCLDKGRMLREINQLKISLNIKESSEEKNHEKTKTRPEIPGESHRRSNSPQTAKNAISLVDARPDVLITEREILVTLMEMKLDPQQVRTICRSLRNKMKETNGLELRDEMTQVIEEETQKKSETCECQCRGENAASGLPEVETRETNLPIKSEESQTDEKKVEVVSEASQVEGQTKEITTSTSVGQIRKETRDISSSNSELQKLSEVSQQTEESDEIVAESQTNDSPQREETKFQKTSPRSDEDEKIETEKKKQSKRKKTASTGKKTIEQNSQVVKKESQPVLESIQEIDNKISRVAKPSAKETGDSKKPSIPSRARKSTNKENVDLEKSRRKKTSTKIEAPISDEEATTTEIVTEKDSHEPQHEKIDEITDDELASLPEDISQAMNESLSTIDSEKSEKSRTPRAKAQTQHSSIFEPENSDEKKNNRQVEESEEEEMSTSTKFERQARGGSESGNETDNFKGDDAIVGKTRKKSKFHKVTSEKGKKVSTPTSPNNQRNKSPNRDETVVPQKSHRKSVAPGSRTSDLGPRNPPIPIELLRSRRATNTGIAEQNQSPRRSSTVDHDSIWQILEPACNREGSLCKRRKRNELICSPCCAKQSRKSDFQNAIATSLETVRTCVREPIKSIFREASITTESEITLQTRNDDEGSATTNLENLLDRHEVQDESGSEAKRETAPFPWLSEESERGSRERQEKLELSGPRRDTIHRRTSLIRSVRIAMESLKKRRKSSNASSRNSQENIANAASTWDTMVLPDSSENLGSSYEENSKLPATSKSPQRGSEDRKKFSRSPSISISPITLMSPRDSRDRGKLSKTPSIDVSADETIPLVPPTKSRCRPDCRGPWSNWNRSRRNSQSPKSHERAASQSSRSFDSTGDNEDND